jgi:DNA-binding response OmpR family regulator
MARSTGNADAAPPSPHLLVVDDDPDVRDVARRYFEGQGFRVSTADGGARMREVISDSDVDLVLLDLGLPGEDGLVLARHLREHWDGAVIIVTGRGSPVDRVVGLEVGADDYVAKPFDLRELLARVRSVLRRTARASASGPASGDRVAFGGFVLERAARVLRDAHGKAVPLTTGEFDLLCAFIDNPNRVLSRDDLMTRLHGREAGPFDRAVDMQVGRLRRKIEADAASPELIKSVRGAGYVFTAAVRKG